MDSKRLYGMGGSLNHATKSLGSTVKAAYKLAPFAVVLLGLMSAGLVWVTAQWTPLMTGSAVVLILILSLAIFAFRGNFGEALLSLVGGILSIFAYEWTVERYIAFSVAWIAFALFAILIASLKIAAKNEEIYLQAALRLVGSGPELKRTEKQLRQIGARTELSMLGPIERAETIRTFAFRAVPVELFSSGLAATENLSVITKCSTEVVAVFVADLLRSFRPQDDREARRLTDVLHKAIRDTPVPPTDYFAAFERTRWLIVSEALKPSAFLEDLQECLSRGVPVNDVCKMIQAKRGVAT